MSTDIPASGVTFDAEPTLPRKVQPVSHEIPDSSSCQNDLCQPQSSTSEEVAKSRHSLSSSSTEDTTENSDTLLNQLHSTATKQRGNVIRKPPEDWAFNDLLLQIDDYVTTFAPDSLEKFKSLFRGPGPSSYKKKKLQDCRTCMQFFNILREDLYLSKDNTLYLQKFLHMLGNKELIEKIIKYCKTEGTLYFYKAEEEPEQGNAPVMFHVKGKDLDYFTPEYLREVRDTVAAILCVPHEHVLIAGLKPSDSFLITLIIPDIYVDILQTMLNNEEEMLQLSKKNIDYILINQTQYFTVRYVGGGDFPTTEQQRTQELEDTQEPEPTTDQFCVTEHSEDKLLELQKENDRLKSENEKLALETFVLLKMDIKFPSWDAAIEDLQEALQEAERNKIDTKLIQRIIEANTAAVSTNIRFGDECQREMVATLWKKKMALYQKIFHLLISKQIQAEEFLILKYSLCTLIENVSLSDINIKVFNDISAEVTDEERRTLMESYEWKDKDIVKACVDADKKLLLLGLLCKETEKRQSEVSVERFCSDIFERIQRKDLFETFQRKIKEKLMEMQLGNKEALMADVYKFSSEFANKYMHELMEQAAGKTVCTNPTPRLIPVQRYDTFEDNLD